MPKSTAKPNQDSAVEPSPALRLIDEILSLIPANNIGLAMMERYGSTEFKAKMFEARTKAVELRKIFAGE